MCKRTKKWTTKDGTKIRICDMETSHIQNTIAMLERKHTEILDNASKSELGAIAVLYIIDRYGDDVDSIHPLYDDLCAELDRRMEKRDVDGSRDTLPF